VYTEHRCLKNVSTAVVELASRAACTQWPGTKECDMEIQGVGIGRGVAVGPVIHMAAGLDVPGDEARPENPDGGC